MDHAQDKRPGSRSSHFLPPLSTSPSPLRQTPVPILLWVAVILSATGTAASTASGAPPNLSRLWRHDAAPRVFVLS